MTKKLYFNIFFLSPFTITFPVFFIFLFGLIFFSPQVEAAATCTLSVSALPSAKQITQGSKITYAIKVKNTGKVACKKALFYFYYSENETFATSTPAPTVDPDQNNDYWNIGPLALGAEYKLILTSTHLPKVQGTEIDSTGCAVNDASGYSCASNTINIVVDPPPPIVTPPAASSTPPATQGESTSTSPTSTSTPKTKPTERGVWIWKSPIQMSTAEADTALANAAQYNFNTIYITIDDYLDIAVLPRGSVKTEKKAAYFAALAHIIKTAQNLGMEVVIEGGAPDWGNQGNRWKGYTLIDFLNEYSLQYPSLKIKSLQYDVEPYLLQGYEANKAAILADYIGFIDETVTRMQALDTAFSIVIPHFYDSSQGWTAKVTYGGVSDYPFTHLLKVLEKKLGSEILIMAYRNYFSGPGGTQEISEPEVKEASGGFKTQVVIAQETADVSPPYITFFGYSKKDFAAALDTITRGYSQYSNFGGIAVEYLDTFLDMK